MKDYILLEVAARWEAEAAESMNNRSWTDKEWNCEKGHREGLRRCADTLRQLVKQFNTPDPLDSVITSLLQTMNAAEREEFRVPDQMMLKACMRHCGMTALPNAAPPESFERADGESVCATCGHRYVQHPMDWRVIGYGNVPFLNVLCDGRRVKL